MVTKEVLYEFLLTLGQASPINTVKAKGVVPCLEVEKSLELDPMALLHLARNCTVTMRSVGSIYLLARAISLSTDGKLGRPTEYIATFVTNPKQFMQLVVYLYYMKSLGKGHIKQALIRSFNNLSQEALIKTHFKKRIPLYLFDRQCEYWSLKDVLRVARLNVESGKLKTGLCEYIKTGNKKGLEANKYMLDLVEMLEALPSFTVPGLIARLTRQIVPPRLIIPKQFWSNLYVYDACLQRHIVSARKVGQDLPKLIRKGYLGDATFLENLVGVFNQRAKEHVLMDLRAITFLQDALKAMGNKLEWQVPRGKASSGEIVINLPMSERAAWAAMSVIQHLKPVRVSVVKEGLHKNITEQVQATKFGLLGWSEIVKGLSTDLIEGNKVETAYRLVLADRLCDLEPSKSAIVWYLNADAVPSKREKTIIGRTNRALALAQYWQGKK